MADPISITSLVLDVSHALSSLIKYAKSVQGARFEMRKLSEELFALKGILEHLTTHTSDDIPKRQEIESEIFSESEGDVMAKVLHATNEFLQSLLAELEIPRSQFKRLAQSLKWPFTQEQFNNQLARLERVKSWLILVLIADHSSSDRRLQEEISDLASSLKKDLQIRDQERHQAVNKELFQWIAPVNPASSHLRASKRHSIGTGGWFVEGPLRKFLQNKEEEKRVFFLSGKCTW